ncbi:MAG: Tm-1-like ATP-binding domain-containing protein [Oscillospiraceae bacterium]|nr:Tm-1-like ATP-binding domain-containing protein [Oscillospiraceae bacterium]
MSKKHIVAIGTLDTKDPEYEYLLKCLDHYGFETILIDLSCYRNSTKLNPNYTCVEMAQIGGKDFAEISQTSRLEASKPMIAAGIQVCQELHAAGKLDGIIGMGGANGTYISGSIMKALPMGIPKFIISVVAAGNVRESVGSKDITLINCVADITLNRFTAGIIAGAAAGLAGILTLPPPPPLETGSVPVASTMMGLNQDCVIGAKDILEPEGFEVTVFHSNGIGGGSMEEMIAGGRFQGVLDLTLNELANTPLAGVFDSGPDRGWMALEAGIPTVFVPGCLDFVNFWGRNIPEKYRDRSFIFHNATNTLMRVTPAEIRECAKRLGEKINRGTGPVTVLVPLGGLSNNDRDGRNIRGRNVAGEDVGSWYDPAGPAAFLEGIREAVTRADVEIRAVDCHINETQFAAEVAAAFRAICAID